ncbi:MAG TPA: SRPBCC domain-containing protein [Saprospiraceae bacterium]|nr:SRPBCC domain-containing protein [Saprospiraceae bacterium]
MDTSHEVNKSVLINASKAKIWKALTDPNLIKEYLYGTETITDWQVGGDLIFQGEWEGQPYKDKGHILEITPERILSYDYWSGFSGMEDIPENYSIVTYTLQDEGDGVRLRITQTGFKNEENKNHSETGWPQVLIKIKEISEAL